MNIITKKQTKTKQNKQDHEDTALDDLAWFIGLSLQALHELSKIILSGGIIILTQLVKIIQYVKQIFLKVEKSEKLKIKKIGDTEKIDKKENK